jgi:hypothetical protein
MRQLSTYMFKAYRPLGYTRHGWQSWLLWGLLPWVPMAIRAAPENPVTLLFWGDSAGHIGGLAPDTTAGDLLRLGGLLRQERARLGEDRVLALAGGGMLSGSLPANLRRGELSVEVLRALAPAAWVPGLPDLAWGGSRLAELQPLLPPALAANLTLQERGFGPSVLVVDRAGWQIGLIGLCEEGQGGDGVAADPIVTLGKLFSHPQFPKADLWILLWRASLRQGEPTAQHRALAARFPQIPLILLSGPGSGHPGQRLGETWLVQAPGAATGLARVQLSRVPDSGRLQIESGLLSCADTPPDAALTRAWEPELAALRTRAAERAGFVVGPVGGTKGQRPIDYLAGVLAQTLDTRALIMSAPPAWRWPGAHRLTVADLHQALPESRATGTASLTPEEMVDLLTAQAQATGTDPAKLIGGLRWQAPPNVSAPATLLADDGTPLPPGTRLLVAMEEPGSGAGEVAQWRAVLTQPAMHWQRHPASLREHLAEWLRRRAQPDASGGGELP